MVRAYGVKTADVYIHISEGLGRDLEDQRAREPFKALYRKAARAIGLPVSGNEPTRLFFAPLGPVESQHAWLADAFVGMALDAGPPATEDTLAARRRQRMAVERRASMRIRLKAASYFDQSAFVAERFGAWRRSEAPSTEVEAHLFAAYDRATRSFGRQRTDIVGPPSLIWTGDRLGFEAEATRLPQTLKLGPFPTPVASGSRVLLSEPWPAAVRWTCGAHENDLLAAPRDDEILAFETATGALLARLGPDDDRLECTSPHVVLLSRLTFRTISFGDALPSRDGTVNIAWLNLGDEVIFDTRKSLRIVAPSEPSLGLDAPVLGRDGSRPLYACDGQLVLRIDPAIGGRDRILRARLGEVTRHMGLKAIAAHRRSGRIFEGHAVVGQRPEVGDDSMAVVDSELKVRGLERLRVIDSSVFPSEPNANLNAPTIVLAERAADMVRGRPLLPPSNAQVGRAPGVGTSQRSGTPLRRVGL